MPPNSGSAVSCSLTKNEARRVQHKSRDHRDRSSQELHRSALRCALLTSRCTTALNACGSEGSPAPVTNFTSPPSCRTSRRWRFVYSARQQVGCARRLRKWHGNPGEVFPRQGVTPSQVSPKTHPNSKAPCGRAFFRQHRSESDLTQCLRHDRFTPDCVAKVL